jgi:hypothetical protein
MLHNDALAHLFSFVSVWDLMSCRRVCKRWRAVADSNAFCTHLYLTEWALVESAYRRWSLNVMARRLAFRFGRQARHLTVFTFKDVSRKTLLHVAASCPALETVEILWIHHIDDATLVRIAELCPRIKKLDLNGNSKVTATGIAGVAQALGKKLRELRLDYCTSLTTDFLKPLAAACPNLTHLSLRQHGYVCDQDILALVAKCPKIVYLDLTDCCRISKALPAAIDKLRSTLRCSLSPAYTPTWA